MHASEAFVNGAAISVRAESGYHEDLDMINILLSGNTVQSATELDRGTGGSAGSQADEERRQPPATQPGGFQNDPDDPSNPNEVRERHLKKIRETKND